MKIGLFQINTNALSEPDYQARAAVAAEQAGFEPVWTA